MVELVFVIGTSHICMNDELNTIGIGVNLFLV